MPSIIIVFAIALAIYLGYKTQINTGLFCMVFAYIIGCFIMGMKTKELISFWPTNTMFVILSVSLFYNLQLSTELWRSFLFLFFTPVGTFPVPCPTHSLRSQSYFPSWELPTLPY